jgi:hypothetical protein
MPPPERASGTSRSTEYGPPRREGGRRGVAGQRRLTSSGRNTGTHPRPQPGQPVLTPAGVRISAVEADHDVSFGPASRLGGPEVLAELAVDQADQDRDGALVFTVRTYGDTRTP